MVSEKKFNISICSYNVFWKIMKNDQSLLNNKIDKTSLNKLKKNILENIFLIKNYYNPFFYCFQETEKYNEIIDMFEKSKYEYYVNYSKPEYMLTIWQKHIFLIKNVFDGNFEQGRPFTLFIFEDIRFKTHFLFINLHAGHTLNTKEHIFNPIQQTISNNKNEINKFNIQRIIICGDFNRDIGKQNLDNKLNNDEFKLIINSKKYKFNSLITNNKTCCNLNGYGYNKNYDQLIDSYDNPIIIYPMNNEKWYQSKSSDHIAIMAIVKNL